MTPQSHSACEGAWLCDAVTPPSKPPSLPPPSAEDLVLLLCVQPPARVQGTKRLSEGGTQSALHQRLVVRSRHVPAQEQHRVCRQLWVMVSLRGRQTRLGVGRGGLCM